MKPKIIAGNNPKDNANVQGMPACVTNNHQPAELVATKEDFAAFVDELHSHNGTRASLMMEVAKKHGLVVIDLPFVEVEVEDIRGLPNG